MTVVVHSDDPRAVPPVLDELAEKLNRQPKLFRSVFHKIDVAKLRSKGLYNDQVSPQFLQQINGFLAQSQGLLQGDLRLVERGRADRLVRPAESFWVLYGRRPPLLADPPPVSPNQQQGKSLQILAAALSQPGPYQSPFPEISGLLAMQGDQLGSGYKLLMPARRDRRARRDAAGRAARSTRPRRRGG